MATNPNLLPATAMLSYQPADPFEDSATRGAAVPLPKSLLVLQNWGVHINWYMPNGYVTIPTPDIWRTCIAYFSNPHATWVGLMLGGLTDPQRVIMSRPNYGGDYTHMVFPWLGWSQVGIANSVNSSDPLTTNGVYGTLYLTTRRYHNLNVGG